MKKYRVAFLAGCIANVSFARLSEATVRVLQRNGCEVVVAKGQTCCGALHVHSGVRETARQLARQNIDAIPPDGFYAIISNAAGCGSTLKEYDELLEHDAGYAEKARAFVSKMRDVNEFLASIPLNPQMGRVEARATYQDSCHLAHGQKITQAPAPITRASPGLQFQEMPLASLCCGSAGIYNVLQTEMAMEILKSKMTSVNSVHPDLIVIPRIQVVCSNWKRVCDVMAATSASYMSSRCLTKPIALSSESNLLRSAQTSKSRRLRDTRCKVTI